MTDRDDHMELVRELRDDLEKTVERIRRLRNLGRADEAAEEMEQELQEQPLCVERKVSYEVTLGTGGPACGVTWNDRGGCQAWWQDWFTGKTYVDIDDETAEVLAQHWGVDYLMEEDER